MFSYSLHISQKKATLFDIFETPTSLMLNATNITTLRQDAFIATRQEIIEQRQKKFQKQSNKKSWSKQRETPICKSERETEKFGG